MTKEKTDFHKKKKVSVKIVEGDRKEDLRKRSLFKRAGIVVLMVSFVAGQVFLLSAFEAHIINVTARICKPSETRTMGYWKNHSSLYEKCLPVTLGFEDVTTSERVKEIFADADANDMIDMLKAQLLAMTFNIECTNIDGTDGERYDGRFLAEIVEEANRLLKEGGTREEMEDIKDLLDELNNEKYIKYCSTPPSWFTGFDSFPNDNKGGKDKDSMAKGSNDSGGNGDSPPTVLGGSTSKGGGGDTNPGAPPSSPLSTENASSTVSGGEAEEGTELDSAPEPTSIETDNSSNVEKYED